MQTMSFCSGGNAAVNFASPRGHSTGDRQAQSFCCRPSRQSPPDGRAGTHLLFSSSPSACVSLICLRRFLNVLRGELTSVCRCVHASSVEASSASSAPVRTGQPVSSWHRLPSHPCLTRGTRAGNSSRQRGAFKTQRGKSGKGKLLPLMVLEERTDRGKASLNHSVCLAECC